MFEIIDLTIETDSKKQLLDRLNMFLAEGDKIAVIGEEGNGKSTLLKVLNNSKDIEEYAVISGNINRGNLVIGYLEQSLDPRWNDSLLHEYFTKETPESDVDYTVFENMNEISSILSKLGINPKILDSKQKVGTLSGGEKVKIQIAKLLTKSPDILLLDEPTNDLDIETLEWLEEFIKNQKIPILFISHDETLLERVANTILHMEQIKSSNTPRHTISKMDYQTYVETRQNEIEKRERMYGLEKREYKKDKQIISRRKSKVRTAQIKIKDSAVRRILNKQMKNILVEEDKAEAKKKTERVETEEPMYMEFDNSVSIPNGKRVLDLKVDELEVGGRILVKNLELSVVGPTKVGIIGKNGIGKTTLLKQIYEELRGRDDVSVGYMPQNYTDVLKEDEVVLNYVTDGLESVDKDLISAYIGRIKLSWEEMNGLVSDLSFGQKAKVMLLRMMLAGNNVLILDEPTRNMSALSNPVVREMLRDFNGAIISVSHDRKYLGEVCDVVYEMHSEGLSVVME